MRSLALQFRTKTTRLELILLLLASLAIASVLTAGLAESGGIAFLPDSNLIVAAAIATGGLLAAVATARAFLSLRRQTQRSWKENHNLRRNLATAEAMIRAEPQVLVYWEHSRPPQVVTHTLAGVPGLPSHQPEFLRFGFWLERRSADLLKAGLDTLFAEGKAFNVIVKTQAGAHVEADGRAAGVRAVLRFRDVAGYKRDLGLIFDHHANLARDIRASRALLNVQTNPAWVRGRDGRLIWVNQAYVAAVELADEDEVLERQIELLESRQRKAVDATIRMDRPYRERTHLIVGGERKAHDVVVLPLGDVMAGTAIDIDALENAQGELDRYLETYDRTLDRVATAVAVFSPDQKLTFFNEAYRTLWQIEESWLESRPADGAILDRLRELGRLPEVVHYREWKEKILRVYEAGHEIDDWWHLPDGRMLHVMAEQRPDGGVTYLYGDETERLALESRYNTLIRVQSETLDSLKEGVAVFGTDGKLTLSNAAFASVWKLSRRALEQAPHIDQFVRDASVLMNDTEALHRIRRTVTAFSDQREPIEGQMIRPDQSVIDYAATPLPDGGTLLTFADVTVSKQYERALVERNEALVAADQLKNQFIGRVSYELRTPLTSIIGFSEFMSSAQIGSLNEKQREYIDAITYSSRELLSIIDGLLDLATIDAGGLELKLVPINISSVIDAAIEGVRHRAARSQLTLDIAIADDAHTLVGDEIRVQQILANLLSNAVGFSETGGIVEISCWREDGSVAICVEDHGVGIPKELQDRIFDRFESHSHGSKHRGAGLGLAVVKGLVELHSGNMAVDSEPGRGTRVTVRFPEKGINSAQPDASVDDETNLADSRSGHG